MREYWPNYMMEYTMDYVTKNRLRRLFNEWNASESIDEEDFINKVAEEFFWTYTETVVRTGFLHDE